MKRTVWDEGSVESFGVWGGGGARGGVPSFSGPCGLVLLGKCNKAGSESSQRGSQKDVGLGPVAEDWPRRNLRRGEWRHRGKLTEL